MKKTLLFFLILILSFSMLCACGTSETNEGGSGGSANGGGTLGGGTHPHALAYVAATKATCSDAGNEAYYFCSTCVKCYADERGRTEIKDPSSLIIPVLTEHPEKWEYTESTHRLVLDCVHESGANEALAHEMNESGLCETCGYQIGTEGLSYVLTEDKTAYLVSGMGNAPDGAVVIGSLHEGKPVIGIANGAFENSTEITSVTIPASVTTIGSYAFRNCTALTEIRIADGVKSIGAYSFYNTGYYNDEDNWDSKVLYIDNYLIKANSSLAGDYTIEDGTLGIAPFAFRGCTELLSVEIPETVASIGDAAFARCVLLESIVIPDGVTVLGDELFLECESLANISVPDSIVSVGADAFLGTAHYNDEANWENGVLYIGKYLIKANAALSGNYHVKATTRGIAPYAFVDCTALNAVVLPSGLSSLGEYAFAGCTSLEMIVLPFMGETGNDAETATLGYLFGTSSYEEYKNVIPTTLESIVILGGSEIGDYAFYGCENLVNIKLPDSIEHIGDYAFYGCSSIGEVTFEESSKLQSIGTLAFGNCTSLTAVTVPSSVVNVDASAFFACENLAAVHIFDIEAWYNITFGSSSANSLTHAVILYENGELVTEVAFAEGTEKIGDFVFRGCADLTSVTIPASVTSIGQGAFFRCELLAEIHYDGTVAEWDAIEKGLYWNANTGDYTVYCTNGTIAR